jgi:hypothetical protein
LQRQFFDIVAKVEIFCFTFGRLAKKTAMKRTIKLYYTFWFLATSEEKIVFFPRENKNTNIPHILAVNPISLFYLQECHPLTR